MIDKLIKFFTTLIVELIAKFIKKENPTMSTGRSNGETEETLKDKIDENW
jgi:hypothetical protein